LVDGNGRAVGRERKQELGGENGRKGNAQVENGREHRMNDTDDQTTMDDELCEFRRALVRVATVPEEEFCEV
jgi:hypothetical protein